MPTVASLVAEVKIQGADTAKQQLSGVGQAAKETQSGFGGMLQSALGTATGFAIFNAGAKAVSFLRDQITSTVQVAMQHQQVMAQTTQVIKSTGDASGLTAQSIQNLAESLSKTTTSSEDTIQGAENLELTFTGIGKQVFPQVTQTALDMATAMHEDLSSAMMQVAKATNEPAQGLTALTREGVTFSEQQKEMIKQMVAVGNTAGAQKLMLAELQKEFGGSAEAAGKTFGGQLQILNNDLEDVKVKIGSAVVPIIINLVNQIMPAVNSFSDWISKSDILKQASDNLTNTLKTFSDKISDITKYLGKHKDALQDVKIGAIALAGAVAGVLTPGIIAATASFLALDVAALPWIALAGVIGAAVALIAVGFVNLYNNSKPVRDFFAGLGSVFSGLSPIFKGIWKDISEALAPAWKELTQAFSDMMPQLKVVGQILGGVLLVAIGLLIGVVAGLAEGIGLAVAGIVKVFTGLVEMLNGIFQFIGGIFLFLMDLITGHFSDLGNDLKLIGSGIVNIFKGLWDAIAGIFLAAAGLVGGIVAGFFKAVVKFFTDLYEKLVGHSIVPDMINGIINWFSKLPGEVSKWVVDMYNKVVDWFSKLPGKLGEFWNTIKTDLGNAWNWIWTTITNKANDIFNGMMKPFNQARDSIGGVVRSFINNAIGMLNNGITGVESFVNFFGNAIDWVAGKLGAGSPIPHFGLGRIPSYAAGTDSHPGGPAIVGERGRELVMLPRGASVLPNDKTEALLGMLRGRVPGYADGIGQAAADFFNWVAGGAKSLLDNALKVFNVTAPNLPGMSNLGSSLLTKIEDFAMSWINKILPNFSSGPGGTPVNIPGNLQSWIAQAIAATGAPASWAADLGVIAMHESGGNPNATNNWDSNAMAGDPSRGLFQTIGATFRAYALPGHGNILNPVDNAIAAIRYIMSRYGDVFHVPGIVSMAQGGSYVGYANGGTVNQDGTYMVGERGPEAVYLPRGANVISNSQLRSAQAPQPVTIVVNLAGHNVAQALLPDITQAIIYSVGTHGM